MILNFIIFDWRLSENNKDILDILFYYVHFYIFKNDESNVIVTSYFWIKKVM
jgi:hypothetical protein